MVTRKGRGRTFDFHKTSQVILVGLPTPNVWGNRRPTLTKNSHLSRQKFKISKRITYATFVHHDNFLLIPFYVKASDGGAVAGDNLVILVARISVKPGMAQEYMKIAQEVNGQTQKT
jgi:hypothetical protein